MVFLHQKINMRFYSISGRNFMTEKAWSQVLKAPTGWTRLVLAIDRKPIAEWFKEQFEKLRQNIRLPIQPQRKSRGMKI